MKIGTAILALLLGVAASAAVTETKTSNGSALLIHNLQYVEMTHSKMVEALRAKFDTVDVFRTSEALDNKVAIFDHKRPLYKLVIFMAPTSEKSMAVAEQLQLFKFYDEGNSVLFLNDNRAVQSWRILLAQFGFDVTIPETPSKYKAEDDDGSFSSSNPLYLNGQKRFLVDRKAIPYKKLRQGIKRGFIYEGGAISLTPYENTISWPLVQAPERALFVDEKNNRAIQVINANRMNLIAGAQGSLTRARLVISGSFRVFSNELIALSENDNLTFFNNLVDWLTFSTQDLTIKNLSICSDISKQCNVPFYAQDNEPFTVRFQVFDEDNKFYTPEEGRLYVKVTKQVIVFNVEPTIEEVKGEKYYVAKVDNLSTGTYKARIVHEKPGFYLEGANDFRMVNVIAHRILDVELFKLEGLPFLIIILTVFFSALNVMRVTLQSNDKTE